MSKKITVLLASLAVCLVAVSGVGAAFAYFSTYTTASGGHVISLATSTEVSETFESWTKHVTITTDEGSEPVFLRARAFAADTYTLTYSGDSWAPGEDGYYYYENAVAGGASSTELLVNIGGVPAEEVEEGANFNVIVVYESTPVRYNADGSTYADWNAVLETGNVE